MTAGVMSDAVNNPATVFEEDGVGLVAREEDLVSGEAAQLAELEGALAQRLHAK